MGGKKGMDVRSVGLCGLVFFLICSNLLLWLRLSGGNDVNVYGRLGNADLLKELAKLQDEVRHLHEAAQVQVGSIVTARQSPPPQKGQPLDLRSVDGRKDPRANTIYGGHGDAAHLGGFTKNDTMGQAPATWEWMLKSLAVRSLIDVGCGRGISTKYFRDKGAKVLCVEGSSDALRQSLLQPSEIVQHDYSLGPWWPAETFDALWCVEFLEHVGRQHALNYIPTFRKAALIFFTHSVHGGYHHTEVHESWWWKARMTAQGFVYSAELSQMAMAISRLSAKDGFSGQHIWATMQVFINPAVARLPAHNHLIGGPGCFAEDHSMCPEHDEGTRKPNKASKNCYCSGKDALPSEYMPVHQTDYHHDWRITWTENSMGNKFREKFLIKKHDFENTGQHYQGRVGELPKDWGLNW